MYLERYEWAFSSFYVYNSNAFRFAAEIRTKTIGPCFIVIIVIKLQIGTRTERKIIIWIIWGF